MTLPDDFKTRMLSTILLLVVFFIPLINGEFFFKTLLIFVSPIILFEWMRIASKRFWILRGLIASLGLCVILSLSYIGPLSGLIFLFTFFFICIIGKLTNSAFELSAFGFVYITLAILSILWLRNSNEGLMSLLIIFSSIIVADVSAYLLGNWFGGPKIFKVISPNKTLSGFIGAVIFGTGWFNLLILFFSSKYDIKFILIGLIIIITSIFGDLFISLLKRKAEIKDTGFLLPGHGGLLDRADSILPVFILIPILIMFFGFIEDPSFLFIGR